MPRKSRIYSGYTLEATILMGRLIKLRRTQRKLTAQDLAERVGISRGLLQRIEKGDPKCEIGVVFEVAALMGVKLFDADSNTMGTHVERAEDKLALLPKSIHKSRKAVDDAF